MLGGIFLMVWGVLATLFIAALVRSYFRARRGIERSVEDTYIPPADAFVLSALDMHQHPQSEVIRGYTDPSSPLFPTFHNE